MQTVSNSSLEMQNLENLADLLQSGIHGGVQRAEFLWAPLALHTSVTVS